MKKKNIILISFVVLFLLSLVILSQIARDRVENSSKRKAYIDNLSGCGRIPLKSFIARSDDEEADAKKYVLESMEELKLSVDNVKEEVYKCRRFVKENGNEREREEYIKWILDFLDSIERNDFK